MTSIRQVLSKYGYAKLLDGFKTDEDAYETVAKELLGDIDMSLPFSENESELRRLFYEKNGISMYLIITRSSDVQLMYELFQKELVGMKTSTLSF
jgi:hypothetical protein